MKRNFSLCALAGHILAAGILFPAALCATYIAGILGGYVEVFCRYDARQLIIMTAETFAASAVVAISFASLAEWLYRRRA